jgi:hypothetical protein
VGGLTVRGRDAEFPSAPVCVSNNAQPNVFNTARQSRVLYVEQNTVPARPSTSGGSPKGQTKALEKRETKDDLYFKSPSPHRNGMNFGFPFPGPLTAATGPPTTYRPTRTSSLPHPSTNELMGHTNELNVPRMEIGMALGSPSHPPSNWQSPPHSDPYYRSASPDTMEYSVTSEHQAPPPSKQKISKWKKLGGLFGGGKKQSGGSPQTFYQLQPELSDIRRADYGNSEEPPATFERTRAKSQRERANTQRRTDQFKPDMKKAHTAPLNFEFDKSPRNLQTDIPKLELEGAPLDLKAGQIQAHNESSLLNVDIPAVELERYSIMFKSLLPKPASTSSSSLLARRQATLDRLKSVHEALALKVRAQDSLWENSS